MARTTITTGQYVKIEQPTASLGDRLLAHLIDFGFLMAYEIAISAIIFGVIFKEGYFSYDNDWLEFLILSLYIVPVVLYHPMLETLNNGQSIGKKLMKMRVVTLNGSPATLGSILLRWVIYPIDVFLTAGLGAVFILFTDHHQRMGDMAAGTTVIKENESNIASVQLDEFNYILPDYQPVFEEAAQLSNNQLELISRALYNTNDDRDDNIDLLAGKVLTFLNLQPLPHLSAEDFLRTIYNDAHHLNATITA